MTPERKAEIEALAKRMDSIVSWPDAAPTLHELLADNERLEAKLAKAKEALKPFAVLADDYLADNVSFQDRVIMSGRIPRLRKGEPEPPKVTFADYRHARTTLSEIEDR